MLKSIWYKFEQWPDSFDEHNFTKSLCKAIYPNQAEI